MRRKTFQPRADHLEAHESIGFGYGSTLSGGEPYWNEGAAYEFTMREIDEIEAATARLHEICIETVEHIIASGDYPDEFRLTDAAKEAIQISDGDFHVYGRFDLVLDEGGGLKMYEYNADTPTSLLEAAVAQWTWLEDLKLPDQFNSIHEKLIARWRELHRPHMTLHLYVTKEAEREDWGNLEYMADCARQGGWDVHLDEMENIGWNGNDFVDLNETPVTHAFKLYPWEWMMEEPFAPNVLKSATQWIEPAWKMLLSNKAVLPLLWERYPDHPNLLPAYHEEADGFVRKPILGREGANISRSGKLIEGSQLVPEYERGYIWQQYAPLPEFDGKHPVIGSWVVGDVPAGIGIREDDTLISGNGSHFTPHYIA